MTHSSRNRFEVFDFSEEDELIGKLDVIRQSRLQNPKVDGSPSLKYEFLACVAQGSGINAKGSVAVQSIDIDSIDEDGHCSSRVDLQTLTFPMDNGAHASTPLLGCNGATDADFEPNYQIVENVYAHRKSTSDVDNKVQSPEGHVLEDGHVVYPFTESPTNSGSNNSTKSTPLLNKDRSFSSPDACADVCAEHETFKGLDMDEADCVVVLHADYVAYKGKDYPPSLMTFSDRSIKIDCSDIDEDVETLMYEWAIDDDVVSIQSRGYTGASVVEIQINVLAKSMMKTENMHNASGIEELKVTLFDPEWFLSLEKIMSLNVRYKAAWKVLAPAEMVDDADDLPVHKSRLSLRPYFPDFGEQFDEVIYPEGDVDAVSISKRDVDLLNPETFINDTIIDFYIKYLKNKIPEGERNRFHFFNSFFFRKLADLDKNPDSVFDGKAAFQRVRKWTRKVNFFEKDYIFIPVNYNLHWSLIVICHPGEVADFTDEKMNESSRVPCILHLDSIRGSHTGLKNLIQRYLLEEWKERQKATSEDISSKYLNLRFLSLELPQQENYFDCGLFLLHYVELFLEDPPSNFNPFNIAKDSNFLTVNWFTPAHVSLKRPYIQRLILRILLNRSQGNGRDSISPEGVAHAAKLEEDKGNDNGIELISVRCNPQNTSYSGRLEGIEMNIGGRSPVMSSECRSRTSLGFRDLLEPGTSSESLYEQRYDLGSYEQARGMSPIQEEEEDEDDTDHLRSMQNGSSLTEGCRIKSFRTVPWDQSFEMEDHDEEEDNSSLNSQYDSDDDVKVIEDNSESRDDALPGENENSDAPKCSLAENGDSLTDSFASASSEMMATPAEDSQQYSDGVHANNERDDPHPAVGETDNQQSSQEPEDEGLAVKDEGLIIRDSSSDSDSDELQPAKRLRLTPVNEETRPETESLKDTSA